MSWNVVGSRHCQCGLVLAMWTVDQQARSRSIMQGRHDGGRRELLAAGLLEIGGCESA